jgi:hypothetical protein
MLGGRLARHDYPPAASQKADAMIVVAESPGRSRTDRRESTSGDQRGGEDRDFRNSHLR